MLEGYCCFCAVLAVEILDFGVELGHLDGRLGLESMRQKGSRLLILDFAIAGLLLDAHQPVLEVISEVISEELFEESCFYLAEGIGTALFAVEGVDLLPYSALLPLLFHTHRSAKQL